jgi:hypothetical protein
MSAQGHGLLAIFVALTVLASCGPAAASPDFRERAEVKPAAAKPVAVQNTREDATEAVGKIPVTADGPTDVSAARSDLRRDRDEDRRLKARPRDSCRHTYRPDPIDVVAARAKVLRARLRVHVWRFPHRPRWSRW